MRTFSSRIRQLADTNYGTLRGAVRVLLGQVEYVLGRTEPYLHPRLQDTHRLVFVCLGNINRSAFSEAVARGQGVHTCSIGLSTTTGHPAFHKAIATAQPLGLDLASHTATDLSDYRFRPTDLLLVMEIRHAHQLRAAGYPAASIALLGHWAAPHRIHLHDPHELSDAYFRTCFSLLQSAVQGLVLDLRAAGSPCIRQ
ncbi:MAG: phosphotyrosine protein phosphatase [Ferruginibacter sp.]|nr:phosphotyrosine protein phosphatase [Rhodoferax sp.]